MTLTRAFRETVVARAERDRCFCQSMLTEAVNELLSGDLEAGKLLLRDYINATVITFDGLAAALDRLSKSLQRMFGPRGNPTAENIFAVLKVLQEEEKLQFEVKVGRKAA